MDLDQLEAHYGKLHTTLGRSASNRRQASGAGGDGIRYPESPRTPRRRDGSEPAAWTRPSPEQRPAANTSGVIITARQPGPGHRRRPGAHHERPIGRGAGEHPGRNDYSDLRQPRPASSSRSAQVELYPEERRLGDSLETNTRRLDAVCGLQAARYDRKGTLVASGGICLPVNVDYSVPTWSTTDRPLRDGLPAFEANRGGIRFVSAPDIGVPDLQASASGAGTSTTVWTEATDANPAGATKPVWAVSCGTEQLVYLNAVATARFPVQYAGALRTRAARGQH